MEQITGPLVNFMERDKGLIPDTAGLSVYHPKYDDEYPNQDSTLCHRAGINHEGRKPDQGNQGKASEVLEYCVAPDDISDGRTPTAVEGSQFLPHRIGEEIDIPEFS